MEGKVSATSTPCFPRLFPSPSPPHPSPVNFALTCLSSVVYRRSCCSRYRQWVCLDCVFDGIVDAIPPSIVVPKHSPPPAAGRNDLTVLNMLAGYWTLVVLNDHPC